VNERSTRSPNTSQKSGLPKQKYQFAAQEQRKYSIDIPMMQEIKTLLREVWKDLINSQ